MVASIYNMDRFERKEMKKKRPNQSTWYDWLIYYISVPIKEIVVGVNIRNFFRLKKENEAIKE